MVAFDYDAANGRLSAKQTISTLPRGFAGTNFTSENGVSPDARFVYVANRLHDSIAWLSIGGDGRLTWAGRSGREAIIPGASRSIRPGGSCSRATSGRTLSRVSGSMRGQAA